MVAAGEAALVGLHPAGWVVLEQQVSYRLRSAVLSEHSYTVSTAATQFYLMEWYSVDGTLLSAITDAGVAVHGGELKRGPGAGVRAVVAVHRARPARADHRQTRLSRLERVVVRGLRNVQAYQLTFLVSQ